MGTRWKPRAQTQRLRQLTQMTLCLLEVSQVSVVHPSKNVFALLRSWFWKHLYFFKYVQECVLKYAFFLALESPPINNTLPELSSVENEHITYINHLRLNFHNSLQTCIHGVMEDRGNEFGL